MSTSSDEISMKSIFAVVVVIVAGCGFCQAEIISVGAGSYTDDLADFDPEDHGPTFAVRVAAEAPYPYPTSDWWTSLLADTGSDAYSRNLFAIPLAFRCDEQGLLVDRPGLLVTRDVIYSPFEPDLQDWARGRET